MNMNQAAIEATNIRKTFKVKNRAEGRLLARKRHSQVIAVNGVSIGIERGDIVGFIGANGAGKSTTIKMLTGILMPDSGSIRINGMDYKSNRREIMRKIGVVFGQRSVLCWDIPVIESFRLFKDMYRISSETYRENIKAFSDILNLSDFMHKPPRLLSLGQRMRADLAAALLYQPEILFLDEPTIGIDVLAKDKMRDFILEINKERHTTVILTTHDVSDIEALCHKVLVMDRGSILYDDSLDTMKKYYAVKHDMERDMGAVDLGEIIKSIYKGGCL